MKYDCLIIRNENFFFIFLGIIIKFFTQSNYHLNYCTIFSMPPYNDLYYNVIKLLLTIFCFLSIFINLIIYIFINFGFILNLLITYYLQTVNVPLCVLKFWNIRNIRFSHKIHLYRTFRGSQNWSTESAQTHVHTRIYDIQTHITKKLHVIFAKV